MPKVGMDHFVLNVKDIDIILEFYEEILGLHPERVEEFRAGKISFPSVRINPDTIIDLFPKKASTHMDDEQSNHLNHFCLSFNKTEWDTVYQRIKSCGISIEEGPVERWGAHGNGISIYILDPEHNKIELRYYP
ncbi:Virulence protein STM3117 [Legionella steigerwaltii]|uniref:Virulence protein n=1 Tax=Legionella steigerwaltii TaxID=460 RepID=A0A378LB99_9GAMM|nr:VOC family protein [Legionella steigerwaltii]KTD78526.1 Virulence protein [Legionella steigerwaltii]STY24116.1 Virulence protein STM3117 [Legionella steigerwaltii]